MSRPGLAQKRFSFHRFRQIPEAPPEPENPMSSPNDVTIDIPLGNGAEEEHEHEHEHEQEQDHHKQPQQENLHPEPLEISRKSDSISFRRYQSAPEAGGGGDDNNNISEKAHLVPDCEQGSVGRRRRSKNKKTKNGFGGEDAESAEDVTRLGHIYRGILNSSILIRYLVYITPLALLIAIPIIVGATGARYATIGGVKMYWFFAWIEVVWLSLWVAKILARGMPYIFQFLCGIVSPGTRKYALMLRALEIPLSLVGWTAVSLVTFFPMMAYNPDQKFRGDTTPKSWEKSVKNILFALFVCSLIFLAEKTSVMLISISYHRKQFDGRIKESKRHVHLLGLLYDASRTMFPMYCKEFHDEDAIICDSLLAAATSGKSLMRGRGVIRNVGQSVGRLGDKVTDAFGSVAQESTGKHVFNPTAAHSIVTQALERKKSSEALARRIWMSFVIEGREALYLEDIAEVLGQGREPEAEEAFQVLDRDGNGDISLDEMLLTVADLGCMRKSLHHSLHDVDQAIQVLDKLLFTVAGIVGVLVFVSFVTTGFGTVIAAGATSLFSLSFIFSTTAQEVLGSCVFLFVKHPFDVGDRVDISGRSFIVERISLLFTVFRCVTDHRITQVPNAILNTLWIDNLTRANAMHEQLTVSVNFSTTLSHVQSLREEMETFVRDKENCRDFQPDIDIEVVGVGDDMDRLQLHVDIRHKSNWSNESVRAARRSKFMCALVLAMRKLQIRGPGDTSVPVPGFEESSSAQSTNTENSDKRVSDSSSTRFRATTQAQGQPTAHLMVPDKITPTGARSTGFDSSNSSNNTNQRPSSPSSSTSTAGSLHRRRSSAIHPPTSEEGTFELDDPYQTPATSPQRNTRQTSVRYSNGIDTYTRTQQGPLVRGTSTGHRNRNSVAFPPQQYQPYPGGAVAAAAAAAAAAAPAQRQRRGSIAPDSWMGDNQNTQSEYYPYKGADQQQTYDQEHDEQHQDHERTQDQTQHQEQGQGHEQDQDEPLELPITSGSDYSSDSGSGSGHEHEQQHRFFGLEQVPEHDQEDEEENKEQEEHANDENEPEGRRSVSPIFPPSPAARSSTSRARSEDQGLGKPRGPRSPCS